MCKSSIFNTNEYYFNQFKYLVRLQKCYFNSLNLNNCEFILSRMLKYLKIKKYSEYVKCKELKWQ